jgi:PEP-CTERM motif
MGFTEDMSRTMFGRALSAYAKSVRPRCSNRIIRHPSQSVAATIAGSLSLTCPYFLAAAAVFAVGRADAASISVNDIFEILDQASVNNTGASTSPVLFIGADDVVPNGNPPNGTTGIATSTSTPIAYPLFNQSSTAFLNQISTGIGANAVPYNGLNPGLLNSWTLTFTNSSTNPSSYTTHTLPITGASFPAFANTVTITGGTTTPMISWSGGGNGAFVQILDKNQCGGGASGNAASCRAMGLSWPNVIYSPGDLPDSGSIQIKNGILNTNDSYVLVVAEVNTRDGSTNTMHDNEVAISRAYFDFNVNPNAPSVPISIPMIDSSGVFHFTVENVGPQTTTYIDPPIAIGYIYQIGAGDPNFASVTLPVLPDQTNPYEIEWDNGLDKAFVLGGQRFDFTGVGVSEFDVTGIDLANGLNPNDPTAFITALTFETSGNFTGTMTAIIPEPSTWAMMLIGFAGLGYAGYRSSRRGSAP